MTNEEKILKKLETIEAILLVLLDDISSGSQAVAGMRLAKAQRLKSLLNNQLYKTDWE